jgi:putative transcription factor
MSFSHQDWTPIFLKPKNNNTNNTNKLSDSNIPLVKRYSAGKNIQKSSVNSSSIERKILNNDEITNPKVSNELRLQIQQARHQKQMSQKQLAQACNLSESVIKNYENGTAIPNQSELNKITRILGIVLKK